MLNVKLPVQEVERVGLKLSVALLFGGEGEGESLPSGEPLQVRVEVAVRDGEGKVDVDEEIVSTCVFEKDGEGVKLLLLQRLSLLQEDGDSKGDKLEEREGELEEEGEAEIDLETLNEMEAMFVEVPLVWDANVEALGETDSFREGESAALPDGVALLKNGLLEGRVELEGPRVVEKTEVRDGATVVEGITDRDGRGLEKTLGEEVGELLYEPPIQYPSPPPPRSSTHPGDPVGETVKVTMLVRVATDCIETEDKMEREGEVVRVTATEMPVEKETLGVMVKGERERLAVGLTLKVDVAVGLGENLDGVAELVGDEVENKSSVGEGKLLKLATSETLWRLEAEKESATELDIEMHTVLVGLILSVVERLGVLEDMKE